MNTSTHTFNKNVFNGSNNIKQNKNSPYRGIPEDKTKILRLLDEKYKIAKTKSTVPIGTKNLIYFSVFGAEYVMLLDLLVRTLHKFNGPDLFDLLIITDEFDKKSIESLDSLKNFNYDYHFVPTPEDGPSASIYKTQIFDYAKINNYKNILFLDTDIACLNNLSQLFSSECILLDVVDNKYAKFQQEARMPPDIIPAHTITHGLCYFLPENDEYISTNNPLVFNAGQFLFTNTESMKCHFENVRWLIDVWPSAYFYEQSFLNHYFVLNKECKYEILNRHVKLVERWNLETDTDFLEDEFLIHFASVKTPPSAKYARILTYLENRNICL